MDFEFIREFIRILCRHSDRLKVMPKTTEKSARSFSTFNAEILIPKYPTQYISNYFMKLDMTGRRRLYMHFTCATDENMV